MKNLIFLISLLLFIHCNSFEVELAEAPEFRELDYNYNIPELDTDFSDDVVKLGRVLFYDKILSQNGKVSCASCHQQTHSFGDNTSLSIGFLSGETTANSIALINNRFNSRFFWSGFVGDIHTAVTQPIFNSLEMGMDVDELVNRIHATDYYDPMFEKAFGSDKVEQLVISEALAQFVESMICTDSKWDQYQNDEISLDDSEQRGMDLFETYCNDCHHVLDEKYYTGSEEMQTDIGLPILGETIGYYGFNNIRIPSLRNVALTAPYMHDGRFDTLLDVIEHYNSGVTIEGRRANGVDQLLLERSGVPKQLNLTDEDKMDIVNFLLTLTDKSIIEDEKFSNPFMD